MADLVEFSQRPQGLQIKSFKVGLGGRGTSEVEKFITALGRDLSLIESLSAASINSTTTELTLLYRDHPEVPSVQASNPPNGFIASSGTPVTQAYFQYSTPLNESSIQTGKVFVDGNTVTGEWHIESGTNNHVLSVRTHPYYQQSLPALGLHSVRLDKSISSVKGLNQSSTTFVGYTHAVKAGASEGQEFLYSRDDIRGVVKLRYALIDSTSSANKKVRELLKISDELLAFATVQKTANSAELYMLVATNREPKVVSTFPRYGANNPDEHEFENLTLIFKDDIDTDYLERVNGAFAVNVSWSQTRDIPVGYITIIDSKTVQVAVNAFMVLEGISQNYVNVILKTGLKSTSGIELTKGYTFGYSTNLFLAGGSGGTVGADGASGIPGVVGPIGPSGASGVVGEQGAQGLQGVQGNAGSQGIQGIQGPVGETGAPGVTGDIGPSGEQGIEGATGNVGPSGVDGSRLGAVTITNDYTATSADRLILADTTSNQITVSLPPIDGNDGVSIHVKLIVYGSTLYITGSGPIDGQEQISSITEYESLYFSIGSNAYNIL